jgi:two-component system response regulator PilR (NtrC family)
LADRSRHGTKIDGRPAGIDAPLHDGDQIQIGQYRLLFRENATSPEPTQTDVQPTVESTVESTVEPRRFGKMVASSERMGSVFASLQRMARHKAPVLLVGESGTGKELAARGLHQEGPRRSGPFVAVNCGAISPNLVESELFGHEKGAFTGAEARRMGAFQKAHKGTLFLDEIGEMPLDAQAKLLRCLESGEVRPVGSDSCTTPDVRVVAATNRPLHEDMERGAFRADLFFRLAVLVIRLPALRECPEDLPCVAESICTQLGDDVQIQPDAMVCLQAHPFPGNYRELRNVLTRAVVMGGPVITPSSLVLTPFAPETETETGPTGRARVRTVERGMLTDSLRRNKGNRSAVARELGMPRSTLHYKLHRHGLGSNQSQS